MAGRRKQAVGVVVANGRKHLTKAEIEERLRTEKSAMGATDNIHPPPHFTEEQKQEFYRVAVELVELKIFSNLDCDTLSMYIDARTEYGRIVEAMRNVPLTLPIVDEETGEVHDEANENYGKLARVRDVYFKQCKQSSSILGLTLDSRLKLVVPEPEKKPESKFDKFGKNRGGDE